MSSVLGRDEERLRGEVLNLPPVASQLSSTHLKSPAFLQLLIYLQHLPASSASLVSTLQTLQSSILFPLEVLKLLSSLPVPTPSSNRPSGIISTQQQSSTALPPQDASMVPPTKPLLFTTLTTLLASSPSATLHYIPTLFALYTSLLSINRHTLFPPSSREMSVPAEVFASEQVGKATLRFLKELRTMVDEAGAGEENWKCVKGLWEGVEERGRVGRGYEEGDGEWMDVGRGEWERGVEKLEESC